MCEYWWVLWAYACCDCGYVRMNTDARSGRKMTREKIIDLAKQFVHDSKGNYITAEAAESPSCDGLRLFDAPIFAFGHVDDELYEQFKSGEAIGAHFISPLEWLSDAKTVIAIFFPYSEQIKEANSKDYDWPAPEWLHARYDGQLFLKETVMYIQQLLIDAGHKSIIPSFDERFKSGDTRDKSGDAANRFTSNWSERHIAYACGLGTFGLSKGLITEKGVCGRFASIITELDLSKDVRKYKDIYEYCTMCKKCISNCPPRAISDNGKEHLPCSDFIDVTFDKHKPRYGCGKCQVSVPCMSAAPGLRG